MPDHLSPDQRDVVDQFHRFYYTAGVNNGTWQNTFWCGRQILKCPLDLWIYQEILWQVRPRLIIETGTFAGASAAYLASICDLIGDGRIISVDLDAKSDLPEHNRVRYLSGSSTAPEVVRAIEQEANGVTPVLVILDSDHRYAHVAKEIAAYAPLVSRDSYLIVEDTNVNGNPVLPEFGPGPLEAVEEFLSQNGSFERDHTREKFLMTFNRSGYLKRVR